MATQVSAATAAAVTAVLLAAIRGYQLVLSPWIGRACRHQPTCSVYAAEAIRTYGPRRGTWLAVKRVARCHPWGTAGYDPVPSSKR